MKGKEGAWAFAMFMKQWDEHSSKQYFVHRDNGNNWPPKQEHVKTKEELMEMFFGD